MTPSPRRRLDATLVDRGHAADVEDARELVASGVVVVDGAPALSPARQVSRDEVVAVLVVPRFVGRGGHKLEGALDGFGLDVTGALAVDVGASTGGFTDCLLARGAAMVLAVDVGHDQLHERLRADERVRSKERTNVRDVTAELVASVLGGPATVVVVDLSFTSVTQHARTLVALTVPGVPLVVLVKPQFEADRLTTSRARGVIRDPDEWRRALMTCASAIEESGAGIIGAMASPLLGSSGNVEFFLHAARGHAAMGAAVAPLVDRAIASVPTS